MYILLDQIYYLEIKLLSILILLAILLDSVYN